MTNSTQQYHSGKIRGLLQEAFTVEELHRFCYDRPNFRPIIDEFSPTDSLTDRVDKVIIYCEKRLLFDRLLTEARQVNPRQYERFAPYRIDKGVPEDEYQLAPDLSGRLKAVADQRIDNAAKHIRELRTEYGDCNVPRDKLYAPVISLLRRQSFTIQAKYCPDRPARLWKVYLTEQILDYCLCETHNWEPAERSQYEDLTVAVGNYVTKLNILVFGEELRLADFNFWVSLEEFKAQIVEKREYPRKEEDPLWGEANTERKKVVDLVWQIQVELGWR
jgi:hypothetical protein